jgi:mono/diheme cytochrome c family protein
MTRLIRILAVVGVLAIAVALGSALLVASIVRHGFSARDQPSRLEAIVVQAMRSLSIPADAKRKANPLPVTPAAFIAARAHFADHCAQCHANDGSGKTEMGNNLYPKPPDMRGRDTQNKTDGELFYIIQNGVRLTGMPAWGEAKHDDADSWQLVAFIRRLPSLTTEDLAEMERLNPRSPDEWREEQEEREFLEGGAAPNPEPKGHHHDGGHR